jgi:hypothetical protein
MNNQGEHMKTEQIPDLSKITFEEDRPKAYVEVYRYGKQPEKYYTLEYFKRAYAGQWTAREPQAHLLPHLQRAPKVNNLVGPMHNGVDEDGNGLIRYEDYETYKILST